MIRVESMHAPHPLIAMNLAMERKKLSSIFKVPLLIYLINFPFVTSTVQNEGFCTLEKKSSCLGSSEYNYLITSSLTNWTKCTGYSCYSSQIENDLSIIPSSGITKNLIKESRQFGILYQFINGKWYRESSCLFPSRCEGIEYFLNKISTESSLKDTELVINVRDWPQVHKLRHKSSQPLVFSFSKDHQYLDILYPAWAFWSGGPAIDTFPTGIGKWDQLSTLISKNQGTWQSKEPKVFFRGSRTSEERDPLILLSRKHNELIDAQYTKNQAWRSKKDTLGHEPAPIVSFEEHCKYKYLINLRGVAASFRLKHLFLCNSVVLNVESTMVEFFYHSLKPWVHYVPIRSDLSDLLDKINFLKENDQLAREIAQRGYDFIKDNLTNEQVKLYWKNLLSKYTHSIKYNIKLEKGLIQV